LKHLRNRGLVQADFSTDAFPNRTAVRLCFLGKPDDFVLTEAEHAALRTARSAVRGLEPVAVTRGASEGGGSQLDLLTSALRVLEEQGDDMRLPELAAELGAPLEGLYVALRDSSLLTIEPDEEAALNDLYLDEFDDDDLELPVTAMRARVDRNVRGLPLKRRGLDDLGLFAYTAEETEERLALIGMARLQGTHSDPESLSSAERKLRFWAARLAENTVVS
jgi:hypothetical protein